MDNFQEFTLYLLSAAGVSAALSTVVIWLARNWISERIKGSIKHEYDLNLAAANNELKTQASAQAVQLKAEIEKESEKIRFATTSVGESQKAAIIRKLDAIDTLWVGVISARKNVPVVMGFIDILTVDEYMSMGDHKGFKEMVGELSTQKLTEMFQDNVGSLERVRPYVGEYLWAIFSTYQALILRVAFLVQMGDKDPKKLNWHQDPGIKGLLNSSLSAKDVTLFEAVKIGKVGWLQSNYESKILKAMQNVISGKEFGEEALQQAQEMEHKIQQLKQNA